MFYYLEFLATHVHTTLSSNFLLSYLFYLFPFITPLTTLHPVKVGAYRVRAMPLSDALLVLEGAITNNLDIRPTGGAGPQLLKLRARCVSKKMEDIVFR